MNAQLLAHVEAFDSFGEEEDPVNESKRDDSVVSEAGSNTLGEVSQSPQSINDDFFGRRALVLIGSLAVALGSFLGPFWGTILFTLSSAVLWPRLATSLTLPPKIATLILHPSRSLSKTTPTSFDCGSANKQLQECRIEAARLLGLIGGPPLEWDKLENASVSSLSIDDATTSSLIEFLKAHARLLLAVDQAYDWIKVTTSLHLGLGPRSQCVERAELAALARESRRRRRQQHQNDLQEDSSTRNTPGNGDHSCSLQPQRKVDTGTILSLSCTRRHIARLLVDQAESLLTAYRLVATILLTTEEVAASDGRRLGHLMDDHDAILIEPDVVNLDWIKASRKHNGNLLSSCANFFLTMEGLQLLNQDLTPLSRLTKSTYHAQSAREYILYNMLLGQTSSARPLGDNLAASRSKGMMTNLLQYQEQLDGLGAALWSIQQHHRQNNGNKEREDNSGDGDAVIATWWEQVKDLSALCRSIESEIDSRFFESRIRNNEAKDAANADKVGRIHGNDENATDGGVDRYEYSQDGNERSTENMLPPDRRSAPTKTKVFLGKGAIQPRQYKVASTQTSKGGSGGGEKSSCNWTRDTMTEQLLLRELQKRIVTLTPPPDEIEELETCVEDVRVEESKEVIREEMQEVHQEESTTQDDGGLSRRVDGVAFLAELKQCGMLPETNGNQAEDAVVFEGLEKKI